MSDDRDERDPSESTSCEEPEQSAADAPEPDDERRTTDGAPPAALVPTPPRRTSGTLMPLPADQVAVEGMRAYQRLLRDLLETADWQRVALRSGAPSS